MLNYVENEKGLQDQIENISKFKALQNAEITYMPDINKGKFFPNGMIAKIDPFKDGIMPSMIGNDIGCGISVTPIRKPKRGLDYERLDMVIKELIPNGVGKNRKNIDFTYKTRMDNQMAIKELISNGAGKNRKNIDFIYKARMDDQLENRKYLSVIKDGKPTFIANVNPKSIYQCMGTLGSGNHFIEVEKDEYGNLYLVIHTGSRNIGEQVLKYYLDRADYREADVYELGTLTDIDKISDYLHDVTLATWYAYLNRCFIRDIIMEEMNWNLGGLSISHTHNYIVNMNDDTYICKGSIVTDTKENVPISIGPADGTYIVRTDRGNKLAMLPHGAGRNLPRSEVANYFTASDYKRFMKENNIYAPNACKSTLDESPFAYRDSRIIDEYLENEGYTIDKILYPVYNYKAK